MIIVSGFREANIIRALQAASYREQAF